MGFKTLWHPGLRQRILAPAVLVAVPALALLIYTSVDRRQQASRAIDSTTVQMLQLATANQERLIEGTRQLLVALSQNRDVRAGNFDGCQAELQVLLPQFGTTYNNLGMTNAGGDVVCSGMTGALLSIGDRPYYQAVMASRGFTVGEYTIGRKSGRPGLPFAYPVTNNEGHVSGAVFALLDLEQLNQSLIDANWPPEVTVTVTDRNQTIIARHPDWRKWVGQSLTGDGITKAIGGRDQGVIEDREGKEPLSIAFARVLRPAGTGLTIRVSVSRTQAMADANRAMYESLATLALVAFLVMIGATAMSDRLIIRPILQLTTVSRRLAAGDLGARTASSTSIPELRELGKDFDDMATALEEREVARLRLEMERKDLEQQYHQAQKMDAVGRLAGGIAHDFNNMLTAIIGYCELLLEDRTITEAQRGDVQEIEKAGHTAAALTRQLLAFSRREIIEPTVLELNTILAGMDKMLHRLIGEQIRVECRLAPDLARIKADRGQVEQVILNLLVNARDAMPNGGGIVVSTRNVTLDEGLASRYLAAPPGQYVALAVADEGSGISEDVLPHLFEPFFTTKGMGKGTGLGLATIYGIIKQGGGAISVESRLGQGSVFTVYLPQSPEPLAGSPAHVLFEQGPAAKATILVVEDDPGIRELTSRVLVKHGYDVLVASGGDEARAVCERHPGAIHLLLSDVVMPGMSGPKVAALLTGMRPAMKVIYMSGYTDDAILRHGVMAHDMPFLQKPFTPERLASKVLEVLAGA